MRHAAVAAVPLLLFGWSSEVRAGPPPTVTSVIEGRDSNSGGSVLVLVGSRVSRFNGFSLLDQAG
jgi:hypothetical protein